MPLGWDDVRPRSRKKQVRTPHNRRAVTGSDERQLNISMPAALRKQAREAAAAAGVTVREYICHLVSHAGAESTEGSVLLPVRISHAHYRALEQKSLGTGKPLDVLAGRIIRHYLTHVGVCYPTGGPTMNSIIQPRPDPAKEAAPTRDPVDASDLEF